jgi:hypothetical protein
MEQQDQTQVKLGQLLILTNLKDLGVKRIEISFSGSGDSGDIDDVEFHDSDGSYLTNLVKETFSNKSEIDIDNELRDIAWALVNEKVDTVGDWVNNEGGFGSITIDVEEKTYDLSYSQRTTEDYDWSDEMLFI